MGTVTDVDEDDVDDESDDETGGQQQASSGRRQRGRRRRGKGRGGPRRDVIDFTSVEDIDTCDDDDDDDDADDDDDDGASSVDLSNVSAFPSLDSVSYIMVQSPLAASFHSITCQTATDACIILGRAGGILHFLSLPELRDERRVKLEAPVLALSVNRQGNRLAVVEDPGVVKLLSPMDSPDFLSKPPGSLSHTTIQQVVYEVSSLAVWHVQWDEASESRLAICEGNQLHMFANEAHEAAATVQGTPVYLDSESNVMYSVHLEQVFAQAPSQPLTPSSLFVKWHVQPLRPVRPAPSLAAGEGARSAAAGHGDDDGSDVSGLALRLLSDLTSSTTDCSRLHRATLNAAATANVAALEALRRESGYDEGPEGVLGARDSDGRSALHWACNGVTSAHTATVSLLLKWGADPLLRDLYGLLPLHHAANRGAPLDLIRALFLGADCDGFLVGDHFVQADLEVDGAWCFTDELTIASLQDLDEGEAPQEPRAPTRSPLPSPSSSVQAGLDALIGPESPFLSLSSRPLVVESVSAPDRLGRRALHHAASHGRVDIVIALLDADASFDVTDSRGFTPLHHAAYSGHVQVVRIFSDAGASVRACDDDGRSPLHWACVAGQADVVAFLLSRGAHLLEHDLVGSKTPLHYASRRGHAHVIRILLRTAGSLAGQLVDAWDDCHRTPLHDAVECSHAPAVQLLLKAGANVNAVDVEQRTPLHYAAIANASEEVVMSLLSSEQVDPGMRDKDGWTPLAHAAARGHAAARDALLHADASHSDYLKLKDLYRRAVEREVALRDQLAAQAVERAASEQERAIASAASAAAEQATHDTLIAVGLAPDSGPPQSSALAAWLATAPFPVRAEMASRLASIAAHATSLLATPQQPPDEAVNGSQSTTLSEHLLSLQQPPPPPGSP
jgi:ankyrin repeat protein